MKKLTQHILVLTCIFLVLGATLTQAQSVTVTGEGLNRTAAREDAKRKAVEQGVGTLIDARTQVANFVVLQDNIYSRASGYITSYKVLSESHRSDGLHTATIQAEVQAATIENDLRAIGILMAQIGNPRFLTIYMPATGVSLHRNSRVVGAAENAIAGVFARKGFVVLDRVLVNNVYQEIDKAGRMDASVDALAALALKYQAELLLLFDVQSARKTGGQSQYFGGIQIDMQLRAVAPATADLIAQKTGELYVRTSKAISGDYYEDMQASRGADAVGKALAEAVIEDAIQWFERAVHAGARFDVWFRNFSATEIFTIVDVIEDMRGFRDKYVRNQSPGSFQLDVNYQGRTFDFQRELFRGLQAHDIQLETQEAHGNRLLFYKKGSENPFDGIDSNSGER